MTSLLAVRHSAPLFLMCAALVACGPKFVGDYAPTSTGEESSSGTIVTSGGTGTVGETTLGETTLGETTAGETTSDETTLGETTAAPVMHPQCQTAFPEPAPALPPINFNVDGTPKFDDWTDISCDEVPLDKICGGPDELPCNGQCLRGQPGGLGVCTFADIDIWCDGEGEAVGYMEGECWACSPADRRALACCEFPEGYDCRAWPYPADGPVGSVCARHEDCEVGLICGPHKGAGYGICMCPEVAELSVAPPSECFSW